MMEIQLLNNAVRGLRELADTLEKIVRELSGADSAEPKQAAAETRPLTLEDVRAVLAEKSRAGHTAEVKALLTKYGAEKLSEMDPANYQALLSEAEVL